MCVVIIISFLYGVMIVSHHTSSRCGHIFTNCRHQSLQLIDIYPQFFNSVKKHGACEVTQDNYYISVSYFTK